MHHGDESDHRHDDRRRRDPQRSGGLKHQEDGNQSTADDEHGAQCVEEILNREGRQGATEWLLVAQEDTFGWLADDDTEGGQVAKCVTRDNRLKDLRQGQAMRSIDAPDPRGRPDDETHASK